MLGCAIIGKYCQRRRQPDVESPVILPLVRLGGLVITAQRSRAQLLRPLTLIFAVLLTALAFAAIAISPAHADEVGVDEYDYIFAGNIKYNGEPLDGVEINVAGHGYDVDVKTDAEGKWRVGVPEKTDYEVTLIESTLPEGVIVVESPDGANQVITITDKGAMVTAEFGLTSRASVNFFLGEGERATVSFVDQFITRAISGLNFGLMLALAAIGLSLIYGTVGLANFAHAEFVTFGALMAFTAVQLAVPLWLGFILAVVLTGVLGWVLDASIWRPLRKRNLSIVQMMIVSIGLSLALRYVFQYFYGGGTLSMPTNATVSSAIQIVGPVSLSITSMVSMGVSILVLLGVGYWVKMTKTGKATRAISDNPSLAEASGINVDWVIRLIWIMGAALAGLAGILWAYFRPGIKWDMGWQLLLLVFAAVILGGLGTAFGALVGSIIVGLLVEVSPLWMPTDLKYVAPLVVLGLVLLFRPQGILGRKERVG